MTARSTCLLCVALFTVIVLGGCRWEVTESIMIRPTPDAADATATLNVPAGIDQRRLAIAASEGAKLNAVWLTQPNAAPTVLYFPGNLYRISVRGATTASRLLPLGVDLLIVDHRGSGASSGSPNLPRLENDALTVYDYAVNSLNIPANQLVVHGHSLGSFMAGHVAAHRPVAGLVLEGSATTTEEWVRLSVPWYGKPFVRVTIAEGLRGKGNRSVVENSRTPLLVLSGKRDPEAPWKLSRRLFEAAATPARDKHLVVVKKAGHMDVLDWPEAIDAYRAFLGSIGSLDPG